MTRELAVSQWRRKNLCLGSSGIQVPPARFTDQRDTQKFLFTEAEIKRFLGEEWRSWSSWRNGAKEMHWVCNRRKDGPTLQPTDFYLELNRAWHFLERLAIITCVILTGRLKYHLPSVPPPAPNTQSKVQAKLGIPNTKLKKEERFHQKGKKEVYCRCIKTPGPQTFTEAHLDPQLTSLECQQLSNATSL